MANNQFTYKDAGVDIAAGNELVSRIKKIAAQIPSKNKLNSIGGFGGLFQLDLNGYDEPVLVSGTDGVGTKIDLARKYQKYDGIGIDLVAMCVNDIAVLGARPLFFLDYYSTQKLDIDQAEMVITSIARGCEIAKMDLLGGETAEHPTSAAKGEFDLAGFCVGIVDKKSIIDGAQISKGDVLIGVSSSGVHSNGFSLIHKLLDGQNPLAVKIGEENLIDSLLKPTIIYSEMVLDVIKKSNIKGIAHITGGGLTENIPRMLPQGLAPILQLNSLPLPDLFQWIQSMGVEQHEMLRTFNCGIGLVICVDKSEEEIVLNCLNKLGYQCCSIGFIDEGNSKETIYIE